MDSRKFEDRRQSEEAFAELFGNTDPRPAPPAADTAAVRAAVHGEWQRLTRRRIRRRRAGTFALAASVLLAVFVTMDTWREPAGIVGGQRLATVQKQFGDITVNARRATVIAAIEGGDTVETAYGAGLALAWHGGGSLRMDGGTSLYFESANQVYLVRGRVYFDSTPNPLLSLPDDAGVADLEIRTDYGIVRHLGTQYMTEVAGDELIVSVREGTVSIGGRARASRGQRFVVTAGGVLSSSDTDGVAGWEWIEQSTPAIVLDGQSLHAALQWVSRESGRRLHYTDAGAEALARSATLRGDFDMAPTRALEVFMMTVDLDARVEDEVIVVSQD